MARKLENYMEKKNTFKFQLDYWYNLFDYPSSLILHFIQFLFPLCGDFMLHTIKITYTCNQKTYNQKNIELHVHAKVSKRYIQVEKGVSYVHFLISYLYNP